MSSPSGLIQTIAKLKNISDCDDIYYKIANQQSPIDTKNLRIPNPEVYNLHPPVKKRSSNQLKELTSR